MKIVLDKGAHVPTRAHPGDAGMDLYSREDATILSSDAAVFDTGVHVQLPPKTVGLIFARSGMNVNHSTGPALNGVIDENFTGSIKVAVNNLSNKRYHVHAGDRIAQMVIVPYVTPDIEVVDEFDSDDTRRGDAGYGSTGR